jgi:hypothetical protein
MSRAARACGLATALAIGLAAPPGRGEPPASADTTEPEILHLPVLERRAEQGILRPVPLSVELPRSVALRARRVLVHYRLWGNPDWTTIELGRNGAAYQGLIPCLEVSTVTGDLRYYVRVHDIEGRVIAQAGSLASPFVVTILHDTMMEEMGLRSRPTAKCPDPADCPRGLPGCPSEPVVEIQCQSDSDCNPGEACGWRGYCERATRRKYWVSLAVEQDIGVVPATGACGIYMQENEGTACYRKDGEQYNGNAVLTNEPPAAGSGPTRVVIGFERLVYFDTSIGIRAGIAFAGSGPTPTNGTAFVPFSIAVRATHWLGRDPFNRTGLRPYIFLSAGYGMFDVRASMRVREDPTKPAAQGGNDLEQDVTLWKRAGDGFAGGGAGLAFAFSQRWAAFADLGVYDVFPFGAVIIAPEAGISLGF